MKNFEEVNPGDIWEYRDKKYKVIGTAIGTGELKDVPAELFVIYKSKEHPLYFVRKRREFLNKFKLRSRPERFKVRRRGANGG